MAGGVAGWYGGAAQQRLDQMSQDADFYRKTREGQQPRDVAAEGERFGWHKDQADAAAANEAARRRMGAANALALGAAQGTTPSAAEILARGQLRAGQAAQVSMANSARGGAGQQAAALRNAANVGQRMETSGANQIAALRADEMAQAREDYLRGTAAATAAANQARQRGLQYGSTLMGAHAQQRGLEVDREGAYIGAESGARTTRQRALDDGEAARQESDAETKRQWQQGAMMTGALIGSDIVRKTNVAPEGSGGAPAWLLEGLRPLREGLRATPEDASKIHGPSMTAPPKTHTNAPEWLTRALNVEGGQPMAKPTTEADWQRATMLAEEASGEGERKRRIYQQAVEEQNDLQAKRRARGLYDAIDFDKRAAYAPDDYREAFGTAGRYTDETIRRRM